MAWVSYSHANIDRRRPRPLGVCDRCGFAYNRDALRYQFGWAGVSEMNLGILVCRKCIDFPQAQLKTLNTPIDPSPIMNPRPGEFIGMVVSSNPNPFDTIVPSQITLQASADPVLGTIGDRSPLTTQSDLPLLTEITVVPNPDPNYLRVTED